MGGGAYLTVLVEQQVCDGGQVASSELQVAPARAVQGESHGLQQHGQVALPHSSNQQEGCGGHTHHTTRVRLELVVMEPEAEPVFRPPHSVRLLVAAHTP